MQAAFADCNYAIAGPGGISYVGKVFERPVITCLFRKGLIYNLLISHIQVVLELLSSTFIVLIFIGVTR